MKIPEHINLPYDGTTTQAWYEAAIAESMRTGIYIETIRTKHNNSEYVSELQFKVMDHLFDNLTDLRKALDNKAFL
jgi:hypothetical protein